MVLVIATNKQGGLADGVSEQWQQLSIHKAERLAFLHATVTSGEMSAPAQIDDNANALLDMKEVLEQAVHLIYLPSMCSLRSQAKSRPKGSVVNKRPSRIEHKELAFDCVGSDLAIGGGLALNNAKILNKDGDRSTDIGARR